MTYGQKVNRIKKSIRHMPVPMQLWCLEAALKEVLGVESTACIKVDGQLISSYPAYQEGMAQWKLDLQDINELGRGQS